MFLYLSQGVDSPRLTKTLHYNKISPVSQKETKGRLIVAFFISSVTQLKWESVVNRLDYLHYMH